MNTWQKVFEYMDNYTEQVDLVKIKLRQKQALGLLAGAIADELTDEALRPYLQNLVKVQTIYAMTIFRLEDIKPAMHQKELVHNATPDVLVNYWLKNLEGGKNTAKVYQTVRTLAELNSLDYDLLVYNAFYDQQEEREAETLSGAWSKLVQSVKKYFAF
jgi:hypothetical protein